jgi:hypothetical protein
MWHLKMRDTHKEWIDLGSHECISAAARQVLKLESNDPTEPIASLFFQVYADPVMEKSDAEILSRLEYQGGRSFYVLTREMQ